MKAKPNTAKNPSIHQTCLKAGAPAPWFEGIDQNGSTVNLHSFPGRTILLYFYPKDDTSPCINQACSLRDGYDILQTNNYAIVGVSADDILTHAVYASQHQLPFSLLADTELKIIKDYDVWGPKIIAGRLFDGIIRTSFIIEQSGIIKHVVLNPKTIGHAQEILDLSAK